MRGLVDGDVAEVVVVVDADADTAGLVGDAMADMFVFRYSCTRLKPQPPKPISTNPFPTKIKFPSDQNSPLKPSILLSLRISDGNSNPPCLTQSMRSKGFLVRPKRLPFLYLKISPSPSVASDKP